MSMRVRMNMRIWGWEWGGCVGESECGRGGGRVAEWVGEGVGNKAICTSFKQIEYHAVNLNINICTYAVLIQDNMKTQLKFYHIII